jgi:dTDP-4-amino-4,6-dideoxygalactose transaminase
MILLNDFVRQWQDTNEDACGVFANFGESGWYILGKSVERFEQALASYWGLPHAVGVANGLDAIEIALRVLGCKAGDKVLTTPLSAFATTLAIVKVGATPVFVDTDEFGLLDLEAARRTLAADRSIRFAVPVHLYGHSLDAIRLAELRDEFQLAMVEDCAQAIGASFLGTPAGTTAQIAATSFYPTKNLGALGDGGALLMSDAAHTQWARMYRDYGQSGKYVHDVIGYNSRLDELQAALLLHTGLPRLRTWTQRRAEVAKAYIAGIDNRSVRMCGTPPGSESCWHLFPVHVAAERRDAFRAHLQTRGISTGLHYPFAIPHQKALQDVPFIVAHEGIERALSQCRTEVSLPVHPYLSNEEVATVIAVVNEWDG